MALALGLKVDSQALPPSIRSGILSGQINLNDPATTLALLRLQAVVGLTGFFQPNGSLKSIGIQCALCPAIHRRDEFLASSILLPVHTTRK